MKSCIYLLVLILWLPAYSAARAQGSPCDTPENRQFDFWLGDWVVFDSLGQEVGHNLITREQKGCLLVEMWTSASGRTGTSYNYYLRQDSTWNQVWVDDNGGVLELKGRLEGTSMVLTSEARTGPQGRTFHHRITWEPLGDQVIQTWVILNESLRFRSLQFRGFYRRK